MKNVRLLICILISFVLTGCSLEGYSPSAMLSTPEDEKILTIELLESEISVAEEEPVAEITVENQTGEFDDPAQWTYAYGQLEDAVTVKKGEKVTQGQRIGAVDDPTKYGAALGSHLEFAMEQNGEPKDPVKHLQKAE